MEGTQKCKLTKYKESPRVMTSDAQLCLSEIASGSITIWLGIGTKTTWTGLGKYHVWG